MLTLQAFLKWLLINLLILCVIGVGVSGLALYFGIAASSVVLSIHLFCGIFLVLLAVIHLIHRRKKLLKLSTQFSDALFRHKYPSFCNLDRLLMTFENVSPQTLAAKLQLPLDEIMRELEKGKVHIIDPAKTLRENLKGNDEKLFSAITIVMQLRFNPLIQK